MTKRREAILMTIKSIGDKRGKHYSWPAQKRLLELLKLCYGIVISRRTLCRDLRWLEDNDFINRLRRHFKNSCGILVLRSTLYFLKRKAYKVFDSLWYWLNKHHHHFAVTKLSQYKQTHSKVSGSFGLVGDVLGVWSKKETRLRPS